MPAILVGIKYKFDKSNSQIWPVCHGFVAFHLSRYPLHIAADTYHSSLQIPIIHHCNTHYLLLQKLHIHRCRYPLSIIADIHYSLLQIPTIHCGVYPISIPAVTHYPSLQIQIIHHYYPSLQIPTIHCCRICPLYVAADTQYS